MLFYPSDKKSRLIFASLLLLVIFGTIILIHFFIQNYLLNKKEIARIDHGLAVTAKFNDFKSDHPTTNNSTTIKNFVCVAQDISTQRLDLTKGFFALFTVDCLYQDKNGQEQIIKLPLVIGNNEQVLIHGYEARDWWVDPADGWREKVWIENESKEEQKRYWNSWLEKVGFTGIGHIFNPVLERTNQGFGAEAMTHYYPDQALDNFAQTGDPNYLGGILWTTSPGVINTLNNITPTGLTNITP